MTETAMLSAREEWKRYWTLPLAAGLGNVGSIIHIYALGAFMAPLSAEFGWSRAEISSGITVSNSGTALLGLMVGILVDRLGPRKVGLVGATAMAVAFGLLGTATGTYANWVLLWLGIAFAATATQTTIWTSAVTSRFDRSRGIAIALTIAVNGAAATLLPILSTLAIGGLGWRHAFFALAGGWIAITLPMLLLFFRGAAEEHIAAAGSQKVVASANLPGLEVKQVLTALPFWRLALAGCLFSFVAMSMIVHFVPILTDRGLSPVEAASIAGIVGIASIGGRFVTGYLLDRFPAERVALVGLSLPVLSALLLLNGHSVFAYSVAAAIAGFSLGAELDVLIYLTSRRFGLKRFGTLFSIIMLSMSVGTSTGPLTAGWIFDRFGSYDNYLLLVIPLVLIAALSVGTLRPAAQSWQTGQSGH
ncbi:MAG: MFS transporter [Novosphingobium sp.]|nr:MFS transporter [Novosphingobium sp.]